MTSSMRAKLLGPKSGTTIQHYLHHSSPKSTLRSWSGKSPLRAAIFGLWSLAGMAVLSGLSGPSLVKGLNFGYGMA